MKKNKKKAINVTAFCYTLLITGICFAAQVDNEAISNHCQSISITLDKMFEENKSIPCAHDVHYAGWVMQGAAASVRAGEYPIALKNLTLAGEHLNRIYFKSHECSYFSQKVMPFLDQVKMLNMKIEDLIHR